MFLQTYVRRLLGWELAKGTTFLYKKILVPRTHVLVQILVNFGGNFFFTGKLKVGCEPKNLVNFGGNFLFPGKLKQDVRRILDDEVYRKAQRQFSKISGWISVGRENNWLESYVLCPQRLKVNKGEKYNHSRPLNYQNINKKNSNLHVQTPGLSAPRRMLLKHLR